MRTALFTNVALLGDGVCNIPSVKKWSEENPEYNIELRVQNQRFCNIYKGLDFCTTVISKEEDFEKVKFPEDREDYDFFYCLTNPKEEITPSAIAWQSKCHLIEGCSNLLLKKSVSPIPILPRLEPKNYLDVPYLSVVPWAGHHTNNDGSNERSLSYNIWRKILKFLSPKIKIVIFGHPGSPWELFSKYVKPNNNIIFADIPEVKDSVEYIVSNNSYGFIGMDSGITHCVSGAINQIQRGWFPTVFLPAHVPDLPVIYPHGIPKKNMVVYRNDHRTTNYASIYPIFKSFINLII